MKLSFARAVRVCLLAAALHSSGAHAAEAADTLSLRQAIDAALVGNPELQGFAFRFRAQEARAQQAALRPAAEASVELENFGGSSETRGLDAAEATFALSQVVELGGKREARVAAAAAGRTLLDAERQVRQLDVLAEVTRRFITLAARQEQLELARSAVELAQRTVAASERRVNAGKSPHAELDRAQIALDRARLDARRALTEIETARKQLAAMWGESRPVIQGRPFGEVQADLFTMPPVGEFSELVQRLSANPDFLRFASEMRLREAQLRLAATVGKPDMQFSLGVRRFEQSGDKALFTVADLSSVWVELSLFPRDLPKVRVGQPVRISSADAAMSAMGRVVYVAPFGTTASQTLTAPVLLDNAQRAWAPGLYVTAEVVLAESPVATGIRSEAIQTLQGRTVVFAKTDAGFEPRPIRVGRSDSEHSEVLEGLSGREQYAAKNSFILKAELGKSGAGHDH